MAGNAQPVAEVLADRLFVVADPEPETVLIPRRATSTRTIHRLTTMKLARIERSSGLR